MYFKKLMHLADHSQIWPKVPALIVALAFLLGALVHLLSGFQNKDVIFTQAGDGPDVAIIVYLTLTIQAFWVHITYKRNKESIPSIKNNSIFVVYIIFVAIIALILFVVIFIPTEKSPLPVFSGRPKFPIFFGQGPARDEFVLFVLLAIAITLSSFVGLPKNFYSLSSEVEARRNNEMQPLALRDLPVNRLASILDFEKRSNELEKRSNVILIIIVLVLLSSAVFIVFAGVIARLGTAEIDPAGTVAGQIKRYESELDKIDQQQQRLAYLKSQLSELSKSTISTRERDQLFSELSSELSRRTTRITRQPRKYQDISPLVFAAFLAELEAETSNLDEREKRLRTELTQLLNVNRSLQANANQNKSVKSPADITSLLIAESVTRFGVLGIAIFLVQILIHLYRYNTRLMAYYLAHKDALLLEDHAPEKIAILHEYLWPDLQYGKNPTSVPNKIFDTLNNSINNLTKKVENIYFSRKTKGDSV